MPLPIATFLFRAAPLLAGLSAALLLRVLVAALAAPALYFALREEGQRWTQDVPRRLFFACLGGLVLFSLTENWVPEERNPGTGRGFEAYVQGVLAHRMSHTPFPELARAAEAQSSAKRAHPAKPLKPPSGDLDVSVQKASEKLETAATLIPESAYFRRYDGIVQAELGKYDAALTRLEASMDIMEKRAPGRARQERFLWRELYGPTLPTPDRIENARRQLDEYGLGWLGHVAVLSAYRRLGPRAAPPALKEQVASEASSYLLGLVGAALLPLAILPQLGLIVLIVGGVLIAHRVLRAVPREQNPVSGILWEAFILLLALHLAPVLIRLGGHRPAPETQPGYYAVLLLITDLLQIPAVLYLWIRLRSRGLSLAEIGLTTKNFWPNVGIGVLAAMVIIPLAHLTGILTQFISDRFFPNIAPPYHPLNGLTATSGSVEIRAALFIAAAVGAPLLEETFFRGALFGAIRRRSGFWVAMIASSVFFAALHPQLPLGFLPIAALAMGFSALYEWRQSLVPCMVVHAINNGLAFLMLSMLFPLRG